MTFKERILEEAGFNANGGKPITPESVFGRKTLGPSSSKFEPKPPPFAHRKVSEGAPRESPTATALGNMKTPEPRKTPEPEPEPKSDNFDRARSAYNTAGDILGKTKNYTKPKAEKAYDYAKPKAEKAYGYAKPKAEKFFKDVNTQPFSKAVMGNKGAAAGAGLGALGLGAGALNMMFGGDDEEIEVPEETVEAPITPEAPIAPVSPEAPGMFASGIPSMGDLKNRWNETDFSQFPGGQTGAAAALGAGGVGTALAGKSVYDKLRR